jgi:hypothetical protein
MRTFRIRLTCLAPFLLAGCEGQQRELLAAPLDLPRDRPQELVSPDSARLYGQTTLCVWPAPRDESGRENGSGGTVRLTPASEGATLLHVAATYDNGRVVNLERSWVMLDSAGLRFCYDASPDRVPAPDARPTLRKLTLLASPRPLRLTQIQWVTDDRDAPWK